MKLSPKRAWVIAEQYLYFPLGKLKCLSGNIQTWLHMHFIHKELHIQQWCVAQSSSLVNWFSTTLTNGSSTWKCSRNANDRKLGRKKNLFVKLSRNVFLQAKFMRLISHRCNTYSFLDVLEIDFETVSEIKLSAKVPVTELQGWSRLGKTFSLIFWFC